MKKLIKLIILYLVCLFLGLFGILLLMPPYYRTYKVEQVKKKILKKYIKTYINYIEKYKKQNGQLPEKIPELVSKNMLNEFKEYTDGKIIYRQNGKKYLVYFVGKNKKDDLGKKDDITLKSIILEELKNVRYFELFCGLLFMLISIVVIYNRKKFISEN